MHMCICCMHCALVQCDVNMKYTSYLLYPVCFEPWSRSPLCTLLRCALACVCVKGTGPPLEIETSPSAAIVGAVANAANVAGEWHSVHAANARQTLGMLPTRTCFRKVNGGPVRTVVSTVVSTNHRPAFLSRDQQVT